MFFSKYKQIVIAVLAFFTGLAGSPALAQPDVSGARDMFSNQQLASSKQIPVMIMFSAEDCAYCDILENEILRPMLISGDYGDKVLIRKFMVDDEGKIRDFDGKMIDTYDFVYRYNVFVTPTLVFVDPEGQELAERIIGVNTLELFGGRVDDAILDSLNSIRNVNLGKLELHSRPNPTNPAATASLSRERAAD